MRYVLLLTLVALALPACDDGAPVETQKAAILLSDLHKEPGNYTCSEPDWGLPACATGTTEERAPRPQSFRHTSNEIFIDLAVLYSFVRIRIMILFVSPTFPLSSVAVWSSWNTVPSEPVTV